MGKGLGNFCRFLMSSAKVPTDGTKTMGVHRPFSHITFGCQKSKQASHGLIKKNKKRFVCMSVRLSAYYSGA